MSVCCLHALPHGHKLLFDNRTCGLDQNNADQNQALEGILNIRAQGGDADDDEVGADNTETYFFHRGGILIKTPLDEKGRLVV